MATYNDTAGSNDFFTGSAAVDEFVINGPSYAYGWGIANDGVGIVIWKGTEYAVLHDIEQVRFSDITLHYSNGTFSAVPNPGQEPEPLSLVDVPGKVEFLSGGASAEDEFVINGNAADYGWALANDGVGVVVWKGTEYAVLHDIERIRFNDQSVVHQGDGVFNVLANEAQPGTVSADHVLGVGGEPIKIPSSVLLANDGYDDSSYVSVTQQGNDAVLSINSDAGLSTLTLEGVNLSAFGSANELVEQGWLTY